MNNCSCGASIIWTETINGRPMLVDAEPSRDGNITLEVRQGKVLPARFAKNADQLGLTVEQKYKSHFATCPNADTHRKSKQ